MMYEIKRKPPVDSNEIGVKIAYPLHSRIYNVMNKMNLLRNENKNLISKWQKDLKQLITTEYWDKSLVIMESSITNTKYELQHCFTFRFY